MARDKGQEEEEEFQNLHLQGREGPPQKPRTLGGTRAVGGDSNVWGRVCEILSREGEDDEEEDEEELFGISIARQREVL